MKKIFWDWNSPPFTKLGVFHAIPFFPDDTIEYADEIMHIRPGEIVLVGCDDYYKECTFLGWHWAEDWWQPQWLIELMIHNA